jgi:prepilin peptidase CpaA
MTLVDPGSSAAARTAVAALLTLALIWASVTDVMARKIRNVTVLTILGLFAPWAILSAVSLIVSDVEAGGIALLVGIGLYAARLVGAGDAKLFAAVSLFVGMAGLPALAIYTALVGGLIAGIGLAARPRRALAMVSMRGKGDFGRGVPYGVAIALAGAFVVWTKLYPGLSPV